VVDVAAARMVGLADRAALGRGLAQRLAAGNERTAPIPTGPPGPPARGYRTRASLSRSSASLPCLPGQSAARTVHIKRSAAEEILPRPRLEGVDWAGVEYFERLWDAVGEPSRELFEFRLGFLLAQLDPGVRVLDVGCGEGWFVAALADRGFPVAGVDCRG